MALATAMTDDSIATADPTAPPRPSPAPSPYRNAEPEFPYSLHWHALNYRCADTHDVHKRYLELEDCVQRLIARAVGEWRAAKLDDQSVGDSG